MVGDQPVVEADLCLMMWVNEAVPVLKAPGHLSPHDDGLSVYEDGAQMMAYGLQKHQLAPELLPCWMVSCG